MRLGFRHTAFQAVCTVLVLCFALGLLERADTVQPVFGEESVRVPILMYHSNSEGQRTAGQVRHLAGGFGGRSGRLAGEGV